MSPDVKALTAELCEERKDTWAQACDSACAFIRQVVHAADPSNKYGYSISKRIKEESRAVSKIEQKLSRSEAISLSALDVENLISDWVGVKITCNTSSDAQVVINKLSALCEREGNPTFAVKDGKPDVADYIKSPKPSGYRAYHAVLLVPAHYRAEPCAVRVEVQIKTRLQDAWGELTHESFYKAGAHRVPSAFHNTLAKTMADLLEVVDRYADDLAVNIAAPASDQAKEEKTVGQEVETPPNADCPAAAEETVKICHVEPRYALAEDSNGDVGLVRAIDILQLLVERGDVNKKDYISVDEYLSKGLRLKAIRQSDEKGSYFRPISLDRVQPE
ncbi:GTP pyrophosphokinase [Mycobacteroides abscessus]|uniref:GTP pyrophosphokinase n=1 Tax=Mycobacteroides abscessus TaxID=36809 RepID=UPI0021020B65|nr:hypothetical protein [Mycobacteroides abscessus]